MHALRAPRAVSRLLCHAHAQRGLKTPGGPRSALPGFAFDIDGVLLGNDSILKQGRKAMAYVQGDNDMQQPLSYVLLTNGGGVRDVDRLDKLTETLQLKRPLREQDLIQSHTPMLTHCEPYRDKPVYVVGGRDGSGRAIARDLGFTQIHTHDELHDHAGRAIWPFRTVGPSRPTSDSLDVLDIPFGLVLVVHDSIEWGCDIQIMIDILSSRGGRIDSPKDPSDASQWTPEEQIPLMYSNGDVLFANAFPRPRLGQGGFRAAFEATFRAATGHDVYSTTFGKPTRVTYDYALERLRGQARELDLELSNIYMVGDNPASDIAGANAAGWRSVLVRGGVYRGPAPPAHEPTIILDDAYEAVQWAVADAASRHK